MHTTCTLHVHTCSMHIHSLYAQIIYVATYNIILYEVYDVATSAQLYHIHMHNI